EQSLNIMLTCAEKIYNTIDDLILLTKLDVDKESFLFKDIDLNQIVKTISARVEKELEEKRLKLTLDIPEIPMVVKGEQLILIQMILHLVRNSIKYTFEGGSISISLSQEDGTAVLRVKDTGQGIPEKILQQINEYFLSKSTLMTKKGDTITVGLNILKKVSLLHNCRVVYKSKRNEGTTVELYFPLKR
ncbi:MAG: HAMP domain-containing histidine kinase, partial [Proteobacteria bacterium]|nr:HAMP domain-containing histidine kinase [Pseudomonadota bacterium]